MENKLLFAKITRSIAKGLVPRERLFQLLDAAREFPVVWISGPAGSGKTSLISSYIDVRELPCLWYRIDERDGDVAHFFYYMGMAAKEAAPRKRTPLPLFSQEYLLEISSFTKRFFEELFARLGEPMKRRERETEKNKFFPASPCPRVPGSAFLIVLENYQEVSAGSAFHDMLSHGLDVIPSGIQVVVLSRNEPPPQLARLRANYKVCFVGWNEFRLTLEEFRAISQMKGQKRLTDEALLSLHERTDGWAAGLILLLEQATRRDIESGLISRLSELSHEAVFDYLASEIFVKTDKDTQTFLLKTAFLPEIAVPLAEKLTGNSSSGQILSNLSRNNLFTERLSSAEPTYHYHPLLRDFLLSHAKNFFSQEEIHKVLLTAARLLEETAQVEEAAALFIEAGDWAGIGGLIQRNAQSLLTQGRIKTLGEWLLRIPENVMESSRWLLYWLGTCRVPFNPVEGRRCFERAFSLFQKESNPSGEFLAWSGVVDSFVFEWRDFTPLDHWIALLDELLDRHRAFPSVEIEVRVASSIFHALIYRQPQHGKLTFWAERLYTLLLNTDDSRQRVMIGASLMHYYIWVGDFAKAKWLIDLLRPASPGLEIPPLVILMWQSLEAIYLWSTGNFGDCLEAVAKALEEAGTRGVHLVDFALLSQGAYATLSAGDFTAGAEFLRKMKSVMNPARRMDVSHYHFVAAWEAFLRNDVSHAAEHIQCGLILAENAGSPFPEALIHVGMAQLLISRNAYGEARSHIVEALRIGREMNSLILEYTGLMAEARLAMEQGDELGCLAALRAAMELGKRQGFVNHSWWLPSVMARLCAKALEAGIEVDYVQDLIRKRHLFPDVPPADMENWPWPLKIYTLGQFIIEKDGEPVRFSGKVQQKPLTMLKALIALEGRDVKEGDVSDLLWPEADGDLAHDAFKQTLSRLRQLLGVEKAITFQEGKATLDPRYCWVDLWAFERIHGQAESLWQGNLDLAPGSEAFTLCEKAINLYKGHFLLGETEHYWLLPLRGRLKRKFVSLISRLARFYEESGEWKKAAEYYERGLEADNLSEELYQRLMNCYSRLGLRGEAMGVYRRCKEALFAIEGAEPSPKTEALYRKIKDTPH